MFRAKISQRNTTVNYEYLGENRGLYMDKYCTEKKDKNIINK